jgi:hypothetical protein
VRPKNQFSLTRAAHEYLRAREKQIYQSVNTLPYIWNLRKLLFGLLPFCAFGEPAIAVKLRPPGQPTLEVRLSEPTVVAVATRPEKWGFFQFPTLARWTDGTVAASWAMSPDSIVS